ncbi:MAG: Ada metal-binding domain-containing protein, partial [Dehalococcoidia bacterium]
MSRSFRYRPGHPHVLSDEAGHFRTRSENVRICLAHACQQGDHGDMTITFTAVRTTGIYCRDGCPGKPLQRNT